MTGPVDSNNDQTPYYWSRQGLSLAEFQRRVDAALALIETATGIPTLSEIGLALYTAPDQAAARSAIGVTGGGSGGSAVGTGPGGQFISVDVQDTTATGRAVMTAVDQAAARTAIAAVDSSTALMLAGNQVITGLKTAPDPTAAQGLATKNYIDTAIATLVSGYGLTRVIFINFTTGAWPARTVPVGYTGFASWDSLGYAGVAIQPPGMIDGDRWLRDSPS